MVGYPRDAPATVLFGEWFRFGKPSDQIFLFEKTQPIAPAPAETRQQQAVTARSPNNSFIPKIPSVAVSFISSDPSAVIPKLSPDSAPTELLGFDAKKQDPVWKSCTKNCAEQVPRLPKGYKIPKKTEMPLINTRDPMLNQTLTIFPFFLFSTMQMLMDIGTQKMTTLPTDDKMNKVPRSIEKFLPRYPNVTSVYM
ncbi:hypothetical protein LXL04_007848 [Taraxacum kok-saghyz]